MPMDGKRNRNPVEGTSARVADCQIIAAIHYLDSHSDYRECLPDKVRKVPSPDDKLVMLEDAHHPGWVLGIGIMLGVLLTFILFRAFGC